MRKRVSRDLLKIPCNTWSGLSLLRRETNFLPFNPDRGKAMKRCHDQHGQQDSNSRSSTHRAAHSAENTSTTAANRRRTICGTSRWLVFAAVLMAVGGAAGSAQAQSAGKRGRTAHHRLHHQHHHRHAVHASHRHAVHASHRRAVVVGAPYVATTPIVVSAVAPTAQQIRAAYPLTTRFHHLVVDQKLPARIVWNNGRYWIWYGGQWCEYGWFVRTQVGGNWDWYLSRYRQKYTAVLQNCLP